MKWTEEATQAISRVPFFVRKRVKRKVEEEAAAAGSSLVTMEHVHASRRKFLASMEDEVKGFQVETCFGPGGCPNRAIKDDNLAGELESLMAGKNLRDFLKTKVRGPLKLHHDFRISVSDCPNACSRPQIADIGIIAAVEPSMRPWACNTCAACIGTCREEAIRISANGESVELDLEKCLRCGACLKVCPSAALQVERAGYRIFVGGKLGRHPQLARELDGLFDKNETLLMVDRCLQVYMRFNVAGERFGEMLNRTDPELLSALREFNIFFKKGEKR
ncbi:MAG TPA: 4Fe-4S dicluster domain-containing protein [Desulfomonilaceae bacterium]|nr:4Fe-4S dicluster domain-containing protein [Desulfomonilaceae bacterium]